MNRTDLLHQLNCDHGCREATGWTATEEYHSTVVMTKCLHEELNPTHLVIVLEPEILADRRKQE